MIRIPVVALSIACTCVFFGASVGAAQVRESKQQEFSVEAKFLNVRIAGSLHRLEALIVKETSRRGRLPIAMINHGKPLGMLRMSSMQAGRYLGVARDFAARGYLAIAVIRRGFGRSDGPLPVVLNCSSKALSPRFEAAADDIGAAFKVISTRPDADPSRVIALGVSAGGAAVLAWGARNPPGLKAVINISGGLSFPKCSKDNLLVQTFGALGKQSRVPALWLYSKNDSLFPPKLVNQLHEAYLEGGGDVQRMQIGKMPRDGHLLFSSRAGRRAWLSRVDSFLRDQDLPTWGLDSVLANMKAIGMGKRSRISMEAYLSFPGNKAMVYSPSGKRVIAYFGSNSLDVVKSKAIRACRTRTGKEDCRIVMENFRVIPGGSEMSLTAGRARDVDTSMVILKKLGLERKRLRFLEAYLEGLNFKALASSTGRPYMFFSSGRRTLDRAKRRAINRCEFKSKAKCKIIMEGGQVMPQ